MRLPPAVREAFRRHGAHGGRIRARRLGAKARAAIARHAALQRWIRARFGASTFASLGLPGGDLVDQGLVDLADGRETPESLLISLAMERLRREGVPLPSRRLDAPEERLYRLLESRHGELAHERYNALRGQLVSFADACHLARTRSRAHG